MQSGRMRPAVTASRSAQVDTYSNVTGQASATSNIRCEATECRYNQSCKCHAGKISVEGGDACQCKETECATFCC